MKVALMLLNHLLELLLGLREQRKFFSQALLSYPYTFDNDSITLHNLNFDRKKKKLKMSRVK
jgi:hypothetical protein